MFWGVQKLYSLQTAIFENYTTVSIPVFTLVLSDSVGWHSPLSKLLQRFGVSNDDPRLVRWPLRSQQTTGTGVRIALLDSGLDWQHPQLRHVKIKARDFTGQGRLADATGHGTQMATLLVGQTCGQSAFGLVPDATLLFGKVLRASPSPKTEYYIAQGIHWAVEQRADILVLPLGRSRPSGVIRRAIQRAIVAGVQIFAAAGNVGSHRVLFPASLPGVVAVTGADLSGQVLAGCAEGDAVNAIALGQIPFPTASATDALLVGSSPATVIAAAIAALDLSSKIFLCLNPL